VRVRGYGGHGDGCGFAGTGVTGTGAGDKIFTRDLPVPIWAGDGSVTRSHHGDMSTFSTPNQRRQRDGRLQQHVHEGNGWIQLRGG
jgi:hypothetical protein